MLPRSLPARGHGYTYTLKQFRDSCAKQFLDEITKQDLYDFVTYLRVREMSDRTIHNRVEEVVGLLRHYDIMTVTIKVRYTEKEIRAYTREELRGLFAACSPEARVGDGLFRGSGCREKSVSQGCWDDVNFDYKASTASHHLTLGDALTD